MRAISTLFLENLPRPDTVPVDTKQLFPSAAQTGDGEGLYVFVRDGHIEISTASETLQLGKGETGFAASLSNTGARENGRDRLTVSGGHSNVFDLDHPFVGAYTTSIERFSDVQQLGLNTASRCTVLAACWGWPIPTPPWSAITARSPAPAPEPEPARPWG